MAPLSGNRWWVWTPIGVLAAAHIAAIPFWPEMWLGPVLVTPLFYGIAWVAGLGLAALADRTLPRRGELFGAWVRTVWILWLPLLVALAGTASVYVWDGVLMARRWPTAGYGADWWADRYAIIDAIAQATTWAQGASIVAWVCTWFVIVLLRYGRSRWRPFIAGLGCAVVVSVLVFTNIVAIFFLRFGGDGGG